MKLQLLAHVGGDKIRVASPLDGYNQMKRDSGLFLTKP